MVNVTTYQKKTGKLTEWLIVLLCFAYPVSAVSSLFLGVNSTAFNIAYRSISMLLAIYILSRNIRSGVSSKNPYIYPVVAFFILYFFRLFYDISFTGIGLEVQPFEVFSFFIGNIVLAVFAISAGLKYCDLNRLVSRCLYTLALVNILILFAFIFQNGFSLDPSILLGRAEVKGASEDSSLVNSITFGLYGGYLMMISLGILVFMPKTYSKKFKFFVYSFLILGLANLLFGASRGPFVFTILDCFLLFWFYLKAGKSTGRYIRFLFVIGIVFCCLLFAFNYLISNNFELGIFDRMMRFNDQIQSGEKEGRNFLYDQALNMFYDSPFIGSQYVLPGGGYPHNMVLEVLMSLGFVGLVVYIFILLSYVKKLKAFKSYPQQFIIFALLSFLSFGLTMTTGNIYQNVDFWNLLAVTLLFPMLKEEYRK